MRRALSLFNLKLSQFDKVVFSSLFGMLLLIGLLVWRGDRVGVQVVNVSPPRDAADVSTKTDIQITFDQPMVVSANLPLTLSPPVSGTVRWEAPTLIFSPNMPLAPATTYTVTLNNNLKSERGRAVQSLQKWQFKTRWPRLLYIAPDENDNNQLFTISPFEAGNSPVQLTQAPYGIFDYALSFDAQTIAYSRLRQDGGSDLWAINADGSQPRLLLECPEAVCNGVAWAPDGRRIIYERRNMLAAGTAPGPPRLWWLSVTTGETVIVFEDSQMLGYGATWAPNGQWLSYVAPSSQGVQVYNVKDGRSIVIPSRMGSFAVWSPNSDSLLVTDIQQGGEGFVVHLLRAAPESGQLTDISGEGEPVEDTSPVWSPDGKWLALTRKAAGASMGKQIWLMRPDGSQARALTSNPEIHHSAPAWSPDGRYLAYQRFLLKELGAQPTLWLINIETGESRQLVSPGNRPTWLP